MGLSRSLFLIKSWCEIDGENVYKALSNKHKIWELMFEGFPSITLQIYALMTSDEFSETFLISITFSIVSISFNAWMYLVNVSTLQNQKNQSQAKEVVIDTKTGLSAKVDKVMKNKKLFLSLFGFMISDYFIRSIPLIILMASIPSNHWRIMSFCILFGGLSIFSFIMNRRMRIPKYQSIKFIFQIFSISILSSFYSLLCTLDLLKDDDFFRKSVSFESFLFEHKVRIYLSAIISLLNFGLFVMEDTNERNITMVVLILLYILVLALNIFLVVRLKMHVLDDGDEKRFTAIQMPANAKCDALNEESSDEMDDEDKEERETQTLIDRESE